MDPSGEFGWDAGIRTPIRSSRGCSLTVRRRPNPVEECAKPRSRVSHIFIIARALWLGKSGELGLISAASGEGPAGPTHDTNSRSTLDPATPVSAGRNAGAAPLRRISP